MLALLLTGLLVGAFFAGYLLERSQLADTDERSQLADTDMDWLGSTDSRIFSQRPDWAAPIDDIVFSSLNFRSAGGTSTRWTATYEAMTESGVEILIHIELSRSTDSDTWTLVQLLSTPINPDGPTLLTRRVERNGLDFLQVIVRGSPTAPGRMRIEYDADNGERKSFVVGLPGASGFASMPVNDAVGLGDVRVEVID